MPVTSKSIPSKFLRQAAAALVLCVACLAQTGCPSLLAGPNNLPNVLVIVVDTLRADRVGAFGNEQGLTPNLDALAANATVYRNAYPLSSWTKPSMASLWTSRYPAQHGVVDFDMQMPESETTVPELLENAGYLTAGFQGNVLLTARHGFSKGFGYYITFGTEPDGTGPKKPHELAEVLNREALHWVDASTRPWWKRRPRLLYLHYMEPHSPLDPDPEIWRETATKKDHRDVEDLNNRFLVSRIYPQPEDVWFEIHEAYNAQVKGLDRDIGRLVDELRTRGFLDNCIIVVTSDHGEHLGEHGMAGHGLSLHGEETHVPFFIASPDQKLRRDIDGPVSHIDFAPTLLGLIGLTPPAAFEGRDLATTADGSSGVAYSSLQQTHRKQEPKAHERIAHTASLVSNQYRLLRPADGTISVERLADGSGKLAPPPSPEDVDSLTAVLNQIGVAGSRNPSPVVTKKIDDDMKTKLKALGYLN
ncbi:MAG: arylsulfatase A-like enzyme [Hyphomicrobiaceae bacterium]|jgi:arylsulfatase A-like enzyme